MFAFRRFPPPAAVVLRFFPRRRAAPLPALALLPALAACSESADGPTAAEPEAVAAATAAAPTEYRTGVVADAAELPSLGPVIASIAPRECVLHFRRAAGSWSERRYRLASGRAASGGGAEWTPVVQELHRTMVITHEDGAADTLPPRVGIRAVCMVPHSARGFGEARDGIRLILEGRGAIAPGSSDR